MAIQKPRSNESFAMDSDLAIFNAVNNGAMFVSIPRMENTVKWFSNRDDVKWCYGVIQNSFRQRERGLYCGGLSNEQLNIANSHLLSLLN